MFSQISFYFLYFKNSKYLKPVCPNLQSKDDAFKWSYEIPDSGKQTGEMPPSSPNVGTGPYSRSRAML